MRIVTRKEELIEALGTRARGLVPTMGALHEGHLSLISRSARDNPLTVVSVFVNPTQFGDRADLDRYPRDLARDAALAADAGAGVIFAPDVETIYPPGFETTVDVGSLTNRWEGTARSGHFRGVATVVTILLNLIQPTRAYFGEKDWQQLQVIRRLHRDLVLGGEIVGCPTVRDADGLALSSRNQRLSEDERRHATRIPRAIEAIRRAAIAGETNADTLQRVGVSELNGPGIELDYLAIVDGVTLEPLGSLIPSARVLVAASVGGTRLIDNAAVAPAANGDGS